MINGTKNVHRRKLITPSINSIAITGSFPDSVKLNSLNNKTYAIVSKIVKTVTDLVGSVIETLTLISNRIITSVASFNSLSGLDLYSRANKYRTSTHSRQLCPNISLEQKFYNFIIWTC